MSQELQCTHYVTIRCHHLIFDLLFILLYTVFALQNLTYLAFALKLLKKKATIELQSSKEKTETHPTLILMNFFSKVSYIPK